MNGHFLNGKKTVGNGFAFHKNTGLINEKITFNFDATIYL